MLKLSEKTRGKLCLLIAIISLAYAGVMLTFMFQDDLLAKIAASVTIPCMIVLAVCSSVMGMGLLMMNNKNQEEDCG